VTGQSPETPGSIFTNSSDALFDVAASVKIEAKKARFPEV